jgi:hypothetical protein
MQLAYVNLNTSEILIRARHADGSKGFRILGEGKRKLMIEEHPQDKSLEIATLQQLWIASDDPDEWPRWRRTPTLGELNNGAMLKVVETLEEMGGHVRAKRTIYEDSHQYPDQFFVGFPKDNTRVPIGAYLLTRALPVLYRYARP